MEENKLTKKQELAKKARENYHKKYKTKRQILYWCRKLGINRDEFISKFKDDESAMRELKRLDFVKFLQSNIPNYKVDYAVVKDK